VPALFDSLLVIRGYRPTSIRPHVWIAFFLSCACGLGGCAFNSTPTLSRQENTLRLPWYGSPTHLDPGIFDPARASSATPLLLTSLTSAGLVKFSPDLHVIPELAVSIPTISTDGRKYTFTIRQDARYADGTPCTAADVAYSLERALSPAEHAPLAAQYLGDIQGASQVETGGARTLSGVRVIHRLTVQIRLTSPDATFLEKLAFPVAAIVSSHGAGGLGPFVRASSDTPSTVVLVPRRNYFGDPIQMDSVKLVAVKNAATGLEMFKKGLLDAAWVPPARMSAFEGHTEFSQSSGLDGYYAVAPAAEGVRLGSTLDRSRLLQHIGPALTPLESIVPDTVPDYVSAPPALTGSTGPPTSEVPVRLRVAQPVDELSQALRATLEQQWATDQRSPQTVWIVHATFLLPDPGRWLAIFANVSPNWYRSDLAQANALTNDPVTRMTAYSNVENWALSKGVIIPLATGTLGYLTRSTVQGLNVTATGLMPANNNWSMVGIT
jgi:ABC-type transport system substrate-binding protein